MLERQIHSISHLKSVMPNYFFIIKLCFMYFEVISACENQPCLNGGTCKMNSANYDDFECKCPTGITGNTCNSKALYERVLA